MENEPLPEPTKVVKKNSTAAKKCAKKVDAAPKAPAAKRKRRPLEDISNDDE